MENQNNSKLNNDYISPECSHAEYIELSDIHPPDHTQPSIQSNPEIQPVCSIQITYNDDNYSVFPSIDSGLEKKTVVNAK